MNQQEITAQLRKWGVRVTPQRFAIAEAVINSTDHPSVQQIFERVRDHFPSMTLATIYSTLDVLERAAIVRQLPFQRQSRYDANVSPHANLVCIGCGTVVDAEVGQNAVTELRKLVENDSEFEVASQRVDFYGWCSGCAAKPSNQARKTAQ